MTHLVEGNNPLFPCTLLSCWNLTALYKHLKTILSVSTKHSCLLHTQAWTKTKARHLPCHTPYRRLFLFQPLGHVIIANVYQTTSTWKWLRPVPFGTSFNADQHLGAVVRPPQTIKEEVVFPLTICIAITQQFVTWRKLTRSNLKLLPRGSHFIGIAPWMKTYFQNPNFFFLASNYNVRCCPEGIFACREV